MGVVEMKKVVLLAVVSLMVIGAVAQAQTGTKAKAEAESPDKYIELLRSDLRNDRVTIITEAMHFTAEEGKVFWPLYREYEIEFMALGDKEIALIKDYADNYHTMTDEKAMELMKTSMKYQEDTLKLRKKYLGKFAKILPGTKVAKFFQIDRRIDELIDLQVASALPLFE
jgi:hypothetical protein